MTSVPQTKSCVPGTNPHLETPFLQIMPPLTTIKDQFPGTITDRAVIDRGITDRAAIDRAVIDRAVTDRAVIDKTVIDTTSCAGT